MNLNLCEVPNCKKAVLSPLHIFKHPHIYNVKTNNTKIGNQRRVKYREKIRWVDHCQECLNQALEYHSFTKARDGRWWPQWYWTRKQAEDWKKEKENTKSYKPMFNQNYQLATTPGQQQRLGQPMLKPKR